MPNSFVFQISADDTALRKTLGAIPGHLRNTGESAEKEAIRSFASAGKGAGLAFERLLKESSDSAGKLGAKYGQEWTVGLDGKIKGSKGMLLSSASEAAKGIEEGFGKSALKLALIYQTSGRHSASAFGSALKAGGNDYHKYLSPAVSLVAAFASLGQNSAKAFIHPFHSAGKTIGATIRASMGSIGQGIGQSVGMSLQNAAGIGARAAFGGGNVGGQDTATRKNATLVISENDGSMVKAMGQANKLTLQLGELNKELGYVSTTTAAALAANDLLSNGFSKNSEIMFIMSSALKASFAASADIGDVAGGAGSIIKALGFEAKDAAYVMQQMIGVFDVGKITVAEYANLFGVVAPSVGMIGGDVKKNFEQINAIIALSTASGVKPGAAMTGLAQAVKSLIKPSDEAAKVLAELRIEYNQKYLAKNGIMGVIGQINASDIKDTLKQVNQAAKAGGSALSEMGEKPSVNLKKLITIFGSVEAVAAIAAATGVKGAKAVEVAIGNIKGTDVDKKFAIVQGGVEAKQKALTNKLIDLDAKLKSGGFGQALVSILDALSSSIDKVSTAIERVGKWYTTLDNNQKESVKNIGLVVAALAGLGLALAAIGVVAGLVGAGAAIVFTPMVAVVFAVVAATAAVTLAFAILLKKIGEFAQSAGAWSRSWGESVKSSFDKAQAATNRWADSTTSSFNSTMSKVSDSASKGYTSALQSVDDFVNGAVKSTGEWIDAQAKSASSFFQTGKVVENVSAGTGRFLKYIRDVSIFAFNGMVEAGQKMGVAIGSIFDSVISKIQEVGQWLLDLPSKIGDAVKGMSGLLPGGEAGAMMSLQPGAGARTENISKLLSYQPSPEQSPLGSRAGRDHHRGVDYDARAGYGAGAPVSALYSGQAAVQDWRGSDSRYGVAVAISFVDEQGQKIMVRQGHLNPESVYRTLGLKPGQSKMINAGTPLGVVERMGMNSPDHMHLDVWKNGDKQLDPRDYLRSKLGQGGRRENAPGMGVRVMASQYNPESGGINGGLLDARGARLSGKDMAVAIPGLNLPNGIPYGSTVEITNPKTGLKVLAKVLDQGGLAEGRELDMTTAVSNAIKFAGLGEVSVRLISLPKGKNPNKQYQFGRTNFVNGKMRGIGSGTGIRLDGAGSSLRSDSGESDNDGDSIAQGFPSREEDLLAEASTLGVVSDSPTPLLRGQRKRSERLEDAAESIRRAKRDIEKNRAALKKLQDTPVADTRRQQALRVKQVDMLEVKLRNAEERLADAEKRQQRVLNRDPDEAKKAKAESGSRKKLTAEGGKIEIDKLNNQIDVISAEASAQLAAIEADVSIGTATEVQAIKARSGVSAKKALSLKALYPKVKELLSQFGQNDASYITLKAIEGNIFGGEGEAGKASTAQAESKVTELEKRLLRIQNAAADANQKIAGRLATGVIKTPSEAAVLKDRVGNELSYQLKAVYNDANRLMSVFKDEAPLARLRAITVAIRDQRIETLTARRANTVAEIQLAGDRIQKIAGKPDQGATAERDRVANFQSRGGGEIEARAKLLSIQKQLGKEVLATLPAILAFNDAFKDPASVSITRQLLANIEKIQAETIALARTNAISDIGSSRATTDLEQTKGDRVVKNIENQKALGIITEADALRQILAVKVATNEQIQKSLPGLQAARDLATDPAIIAAYDTELAALKDKNYETRIAAQEYRKTQQEQTIAFQAGQAIKQGLVDIAGSSKNGFKDLGSILDSTLNKIADIAIQAAINGLLGSSGKGGKGGGGLLGFLGPILGFKDGGDVPLKGARGSIALPRGIQSVDDALRKEGNRGVIIAAQAGERVLNQKQSAIFRAMLKDGSWDKLSRVYGYANGGDIGGVGAVSSSPRISQPRAATGGNPVVTVDRINSVDYVSVSQLNTILSVQLPVAARAGAAIVDRNLQNSSWRKANNL